MVAFPLRRVSVVIKTTRTTAVNRAATPGGRCLDLQAPSSSLTDQIDQYGAARRSPANTARLHTVMQNSPLFRAISGW